MVLPTPYFDSKYLATEYFTVDFVDNGLFLFLNISEKYLQFRKKTKAFVKENFWFTPYKNPDLLTAELFFKLCMSQIYVQNIERN